MSGSDAQARQLEDAARLYDADYYKSHLGPVPYSRETPEIMNFFGTIADHLTRSLNPKTVLDAGCAMGFLVESLWERGVEAWGIDISPYAISQVRMDVRPYCSVASVGEPISGRYDLIACIEVLEHVPEETALRAIENLTKATDTILFSSSPNDFGEPTHVNVRQPMWWLSRFADFGFSPDVLYDCTFVSPQAMLLRKTGQLPYDVLRLFSNLLRNHHRAITAESWGHQQAAAAREMEKALNASRAEAAGLTVEVSRLEEWERRAMAAEDRIEQLKTKTRDLQQALDVSKSEAGHFQIEIARAADQLQSEFSQRDRQIADLKKQVQECASSADMEAGRARELAERSEQRIAILLQQIEQAVGTIDEVRQSVALHNVSWENHLNRQRAVSHNVENRCGQLAVTVQSMEPRLSDTQARLEEITRLNLRLHQQVHGLTSQVREILQSRIWQSLVNAGGVMLKLTGRKR